MQRCYNFVFLLRDRSKFMLHFVPNNVPLRRTSHVTESCTNLMKSTWNSERLSLLLSLFHSPVTTFSLVVFCFAFVKFLNWYYSLLFPYVLILVTFISFDSFFFRYLFLNSKFTRKSRHKKNWFKWQIKSHQNGLCRIAFVHRLFWYWYTYVNMLSWV